MSPGLEATAYAGVVRGQHRFDAWRRFLGVLFRRKVAVFGAIVILLLIINAIFAPWIAPHDPYEQNLKQALQQPSTEHLLGTDWLGRDTLSRIVYGTRASLLVGIFSVGVAAGIGMILGLVAGFFGGWLNTIIMRFIDALMSIPAIILAIAIAAVLGSGLLTVIVALGIALVPQYCRVMCSQVLSIRQTDYIAAGRIIGASNLRIIFLHVLPNCLPSFMVLMTLQLGIAILAEAGLSFLGFGVVPPAAAWGSMISDGYRYLFTNPVLSFAPGLCIMLVVLSFNLLGDGLRDALDPRLRGTV